MKQIIYIVCFFLIVCTGKSNAQKTVFYPLPDTSRQTGSDFSMIASSPAIAYRGGILIPEFGFWLIPPEKSKVILSVAPGQRNELFTTVVTSKGMTIEKRVPASDSTTHAEVITSSRSEYYTLLSENNSNAGKIYVKANDKTGTHLYKIIGNKLIELVNFPTLKVERMVLRDAHNFLYTTKEQLWSYSNGKKQLLFKLPEVIEGMDISKSDEIFISTVSGIIKIGSFGKVSIISQRVHGPIHLEDDKLFVLSINHNSIAVITL